MREARRRGGCAVICMVAGAVLTTPMSAAEAAVTEPFVVSQEGTAYKVTNAETGARYSGSLKSVVERAVDDLKLYGGGTVQFTSGDFDLGGDWFEFYDVTDVEFAGAGMDATTLRNETSAATDTEPFDFRGAYGVTVRDMTVSAGGALRSTSDALDFDQGNDVLVENVRVTRSRGRGIVFDGKNDSWESAHNRVVGCEISNVPSDGIELLASTDNLVQGCTITGVGGHGIQLAKSSLSADQPNKLPSRNVISGNVIDESGQDGINVNGGNENQFLGNLITNSSNVSTSRDGIRLGSGDGATCNDNQVRGNTSTDNQATKTQRYGLNIATSLCNRTVIGADNNFTGNRVAGINDLGTATVYEGGAPPVNNPPVAEDLIMTADPGASTSWTPLVSDPDPGTILRCQLLEQPTKGTATVRTDCASGTYTSAAGATGADTFLYRVTDGSKADTGTVSVTISGPTPANQPPVAGDLSVNTFEGSAKGWVPLVSDPDPGATLTCSITTQGTKGSATVTTGCESGSYVPLAGFIGADSFVYTVSDGTASDTGTVAVRIKEHPRGRQQKS